MEQDAELVLLCRDKLFLVWRDHYLLFQAHSLRWSVVCSICHEPSIYQFYTVLHRIRRVCGFLEEVLSAAAIQLIWMGSHDAAVDCCLESFCCQQYLGGDDLVLGTGIACDLQ